MATTPQYGPKMMALPNDRWRQFVIALFDQGARNYAAAAEAAGFKAENRNSLRVTAHHMFHDERTQEAMLEEAQRRMKTFLPLAQKVLGDALENPQLPMSDRLKAAQMTFDRAGLHPVAETRHTHQAIEGDPNMLKRIEALARGLGLDTAKLLGARLAKLQPPTVIDAEVTATNSGIEDLI